MMSAKIEFTFLPCVNIFQIIFGNNCQFLILEHIIFAHKGGVKTRYHFLQSVVCNAFVTPSTHQNLVYGHTNRTFAF